MSFTFLLSVKGNLAPYSKVFNLLLLQIAILFILLQNYRELNNYLIGNQNVAFLGFI